MVDTPEGQERDRLPPAQRTSPSRDARPFRSSQGSEDEPFLFDDLTIVPPLEEFRRLFQKKLRAFESGEDGGQSQPYHQAFELGERLILRQLGEEEGC